MSLFLLRRSRRWRTVAAVSWKWKIADIAPIVRGKQENRSESRVLHEETVFTDTAFPKRHLTHSRSPASCLFETIIYSDGLSPARETVLELLLRRMSDPGQLVEIVVRPKVSAKVDEPNPFVVTPPIAATGASTPKNDVLSGKDDVAQAATAMVATPAPSANELQCLLLSVATAEGVSRIKALQHRSQEKNTGDRRDSGRRSVEDGTALTGGVGEAAVEMLGRLMNQLLSRCVGNRVGIVDVVLAYMLRKACSSLVLQMAVFGDHCGFTMRRGYEKCCCNHS